MAELTLNQALTWYDKGVRAGLEQVAKGFDERPNKLFSGQQIAKAIREIKEEIRNKDVEL